MFGIDPLISGYILAGDALAWSAATMMVSRPPTSAAMMLIRTGMGLVVVGIAGFIVTVPIGSLAGMLWLSVSLLSGGSRQQKMSSVSLRIRARAARRSSRWHRSLHPASHRRRLFWRRARRWASDLSAWLAPAAARTPAPSAQTDL